MRLLANENVPGPVVRGLRERGHDVLWAKEDLSGEPDHVLLSRAQAEQRVTVTCDTDFGELAFRSGLPAECGVVLLRIDWPDPTADNAFALSTLTSRADWAGVRGRRTRSHSRPSLT